MIKVNTNRKEIKYTIKEDKEENREYKLEDTSKTSSSSKDNNSKYNNSKEDSNK